MSNQGGLVAPFNRRHLTKSTPASRIQNEPSAGTDINGNRAKKR